MPSYTMYTSNINPEIAWDNVLTNMTEEERVRFLSEFSRIISQPLLSSYRVSATIDTPNNPETVPVVGYHGCDRHSFLQHVDWNDSSLMGVELEVLCTNLHKTVQALQAADLHMLIERDGSLDPRLGIELIFPPTPYKNFNTDCDIYKALSILRSTKTKGYKAGTGYGCHISINRGALTSLHSGKFSKFIHANKRLTVLIAQRLNDSYARFMPSDVKYTIVDLLRLNQKYLACSMRNRERIEIRIFRSTLSWITMRRYLEYTASVLEFTKICSLRELRQIPYLEWLLSPVNKRCYHNLVSYLETIT